MQSPNKQLPLIWSACSGLIFIRNRTSRWNLDIMSCAVSRLMLYRPGSVKYHHLRGLDHPGKYHHIESLSDTFPIPLIDQGSPRTSMENTMLPCHHQDHHQATESLLLYHSKNVTVQVRLMTEQQVHNSKPYCFHECNN